MTVMRAISQRDTPAGCRRVSWPRHQETWGLDLDSPLGVEVLVRCARHREICAMAMIRIRRQASCHRRVLTFARTERSEGMGQSISEIPVQDRPRERLLNHGPEALSDRELLAMVIRAGSRGTSAVDLAGELLADFGGVCALGRAYPEELVACCGMGVAKAAAVTAAFELGRRARVPLARRTLRNAADVADIAQWQLASARREKILVLVCDAANRLIRTAVIADGSVDQCPFPVREILNLVLRIDGRAFAIAHNHPSGDPTPSHSDVDATSSIRTAAAAVGLRFLTHIVMAGSGWEIAESNKVKQTQR